MLLDSNVIIYAARPEHEALRRLIRYFQGADGQAPAYCSSVTGSSQPVPPSESAAGATAMWTM